VLLAFAAVLSAGGALAGWWVAWQGWQTLTGQAPLLRYRVVGGLLLATGSVAAAACAWLLVTIIRLLAT
jgi:hypothetical protein